MLPAEEESVTLGSEELLARAIQCFGNRDKALDWLRTPHPAFDGEAPLERAHDPEGYQAVLDEIGRIEHGIFA